MIGDSYPFRVGESSISRQRETDQIRVYSFLSTLGARLTYNIDQALLPVKQPSILFERLVRVALESYLGGSARRFGWPFREDGLSTNFRDAATSLAAEMGEPVGLFETVSPDEKDHGLDVVAWRPFADEHRSQICLLCQCAIGVDWNQKPIHLGLWYDIIRFMARPITAVAFVAQMSNHQKYFVNGVAKTSGILFDRTRLATMVVDEDLPGELSESIRDWVQSAILRFPKDE